MSDNYDWVDIGQTEVVEEREKALLLDFGRHQKWVPRACYRTIPNAPFHPSQQVKAWFVARNNLWEIIEKG